VEQELRFNAWPKHTGPKIASRSLALRQSLSFDRWANRGCQITISGSAEIIPKVEDQQMPWTITRLCRDCLDTGCVSVCPVDCIYEYTGDDREKFPNQLYIHPDECIDCGACEPECPWQAIFEEPAVPEIFKDDIPLNHATVEMHDQFKVALFQKKEHPTPDQIAANKVKWGMDPNA